MPVSVAARTIARRQFSVLRAMRSVGRTMEAHPFQRLSALPSASPNYGAYAKRVGTQAAIFFPGIAMLLGWPMLAKKGLDGHI